jgi:alkylhydroperoxidase/carboxymuconolactone decarboxylase family protein YurZ
MLADEQRQWLHIAGCSGLTPHYLAQVSGGRSLQIHPPGEFRVVGAAAVTNGGVSPVELKEIVYQSVAYVGMARVFDYLRAVNDVLTEAGVELPLPGQPASTPQTRLEYGKAVQGRIVGDDAVAARGMGTDIAKADRNPAHPCRATSGQRLKGGSRAAGQFLGYLTVRG